MATFDPDGVPYTSRGNVSVKIKDPNAGTGDPLEEYTDIGCIVGDATINRAWGDSSSEPDNWCVHIQGAAGVAQYRPGTKTITSSITIESVLADEAYKFLHGNSGTRFDIKFELKDNKTPTTTQTLEYGIVKTSDDLTMRGGEGDTTQFSFDFQVNEIINETITSA